jgi:hypothetical protein
MRIVYVEACLHSMRAKTLPEGSQEYEQVLDQSAKLLVEWFERGQRGGFRETGNTELSAVDRLATDRDLDLVREKRWETLRQAIPDSSWPTSSSGGGCVPMGTFIDTPDGKCLVEHLRPGDNVMSLRLGSACERVRTTVVAVATTQSTRCIQVNDRWLVTPSQPVRTSTGWVEAAALRKGARVMDGYGALVPIVELEILDDSFEVFDLTIDDPCHNYVANGLLCHNKMRAPWERLLRDQL